MSDKEVYKWFIAHVSFRNEHNVKNLLEIAGIEFYMPFMEVTRSWNNTEKKFQVPAIPTCVFVKVPASDYIMLQMMKEISLLMDNDGQPIWLPENRMDEVRRKLDASGNPGEIVLDLIKELT